MVFTSRTAAVHNFKYIHINCGKPYVRAVGGNTLRYTPYNVSTGPLPVVQLIVTGVQST